MADLDEEIDTLYGLPLEAFVASATRWPSGCGRTTP
jgi:hypothetical protein